MGHEAYAHGRQQKGTKKGVVTFLRHKKYAISVSSVEAGIGVEGQNHVHRTMHISDVIGIVSRSSKCTIIVGSWGFAPDPTVGAYSAP